MAHSKYEIFLKTAETGNITRTAERLHYTQAGVSHAIAALEKETGFALFLRSSNGVELTENGKRLLPAVQELVNQQRNLEQMIHEINGEVSGTLRVGIFSSVAIHRMPQIMREFQRRHPRVRFELRFDRRRYLARQERLRLLVGACAREPVLLSFISRFHAGLAAAAASAGKKAIFDSCGSETGAADHAAQRLG